MMRAPRIAILCLGLAAVALGIGMLSAPDPEQPKETVQAFLEALIRGDLEEAASLVEGTSRFAIDHHKSQTPHVYLELQGALGVRPEIRLEVISVTSSLASVRAVVTHSSKELVVRFDLVFYRGVGWRIRDIDGLRLNQDQLEAALRSENGGDESQEYVDQAILLQELQQRFEAPRSPVMTAGKPGETESGKRRF